MLLRRLLLRWAMLICSIMFDKLDVSTPEILGTLKTLHKLARLQCYKSGMVSEQVRSVIHLVELYAPKDCKNLINFMYDSDFK